MTKYLITGGCGFIGSHLSQLLIERGHAITILDNLSTGKKKNTPENAYFIEGSITDPATVTHALQGVDGVFHLAAVTSIQKSIDQWYALHQTNLGGTVCLFEAMTRLPKKIPLIYASSAAVYGGSTQIPLSEELPTLPLSPYGIDKLAGEWHARALWEIFHIPNLTFRFFNVYGPDQDPSSPYSGVISLFSKWIKENQPLTIYGDGKQVRDFIYVKDVVRTMADAMEKPLEGAHVYNQCTGKGVSVNQLADLMGKIAGISIKKEYALPREGEVRASIGDPAQAIKHLGFKIEYSLEEGLKTCV